MSKRIFQASNYTPTAQGDSPTALSNGTYLALRGGGSNARIEILEVMMEGLAAASAPVIMQLARSGIVASTTTLLVAPNSDGFVDPSASAQTTASLAFMGAVGGPQRSAAISEARLNLNYNQFGGIFRWNAAPGQQWFIVGNTAPGGESTLSALTGFTAAAQTSSILYETD
jgi:hypothetical protein